MKIVFCGHGDFGYTALKALLEAGHNVVQVYTHPATGDANSGHAFPDLQKLAAEHGVPSAVRTREDTQLMADDIAAIQPDLLVSVTWRALFPQSVIDVPRYGALNIHGSSLPKYRGNAPIAWAMIHGDSVCGITAHMIDKGMDTGDIVEQFTVPILEDDTIATVMQKLLDVTGALVLQAVKNLQTPGFVAHKQDHSQATIAKKRRPEDGVMDWSWTVRRLYNWVRALTHPLPGAFTAHQGEKLHVWKAAIHTQNTPQNPVGMVVDIQPHNLVVQAADGLLRIEEASLGGATLAEAIAQNRFSVGDMLGKEKQ